MRLESKNDQIKEIAHMDKHKSSTLILANTLFHDQYVMENHICDAMANGNPWFLAGFSVLAKCERMLTAIVKR